MNWDQFIIQFSQFISDIFIKLGELTDKIFVSGIIANLLAILKSVAKFIIAALEAVLGLLKFIVK